MRNNNSTSTKLRDAVRSVLVGIGMTTAVVIPTLIPQEARASGFPTVDIAALIQRILGYITQLEAYAKEVTQTTTEIGQLVQLYKDYEQTLREYDKLLNQVRSLRNFISDADWNTLLASLEPYYGTSWIASIPSLDYKSATFKGDLRTLYKQIGGVSKTTADLDTELADTDLPSTAIYHNYNEVNEKLFQRQWDRDGMVAANRASADQRQEDIQVLADSLASLGDESEVASLQFIAFQQNKMLSFMNEQMSMQNQDMLNRDLDGTKEAKQRAEFLDQEIARLKRVKATPFEPSAFENVF